MNCNICVVALGIIIVLITILLRKNVWNQFYNNLTKEQKNSIQLVIQNRLWIISVSVILSIVITVCLTYAIKLPSILSKICFYIVSITFLSVSGYLVFPKEDFIELHLKREQLIQWMNINQFNDFLIVSGFLIAILFFFFTELFKKIF